MPSHPDLIILQLGHRETLFPVRPRMLARFLPAPVIKSQGLSKSDVVRYLLRSIGTSLFALLPSSRKLRRFQAPEFKAAVEQCFNRIAADFPNIPVVVLSTFPAISFYRLMLRRKANAILRSQTRKRGWAYLDVFRNISILKGKLFVDNCHLSRAGHAVIADMVYQELAPQPRPTATPSANRTHAIMPSFR